MNTTEHLLSLADACQSLPMRRGRPVHLSTLWRWTRHGVRGVRLETMLVGGLLFTSREAIQRFLSRLAEVRKPRVAVETARGGRAQRRMAARVLDEAGI